MSRHGLVANDGEPEFNLYRGRVARAMRGKRGQAFLRELAQQMDAMSEKALIAEELVNEDGDCCTIGVVCKARGIDVSTIDYDVPEQVAAAVGIAECMAAEIEYENDEYGFNFEFEESEDGSMFADGKRGRYRRVEETPEQRWTRMRRWVESKIIK